MDIERKNFGATVKTDVPDGTIEAVVAVFDNTDRASEIIRFGAFADSLAKGLPKGTWAHDWTQPIAKTLAARELAPGDPLLPAANSELGGLYVKGQFNLETQAGREAYSNIKFGIIDQFSIGYRVVKDSFDTKTDVRELHQVELFEWSPVLVGMNPATSLLSIKGQDASPAMRLADHSEAVLATCKEFALRITSLRELRAKEGRVISAANRARIEACMGSMGAVMKDLEALMMMADPPAKADQVEVRRLHAEILRTLSTA